jgi:hypothetical protein
MQFEHTGVSVYRAALSTPAVSAGGLDRPTDPAWPWDWENRPAKDCCDHQWEVLVVDRLFNPTERVARCSGCHTPRCGYAEDPDPCVRRRHHEGDHLPESRALKATLTRSA